VSASERRHPKAASGDHQLELGSFRVSAELAKEGTYDFTPFWSAVSNLIEFDSELLDEG
jgi:hypothetical protein